MEIKAIHIRASAFETVPAMDPTLQQIDDYEDEGDLGMAGLGTDGNEADISEGEDNVFEQDCGRSCVRVWNKNYCEQFQTNVCKKIHDPSFTRSCSRSHRRRKVSNVWRHFTQKAKFKIKKNTSAYWDLSSM